MTSKLNLTLEMEELAKAYLKKNRISFLIFSGTTHTIHLEFCSVL